MLPELVAVGTRFNSWETVGIAWRLGQYRYVPAKCVGASCTTRRVVQYDNLTSGKSRGCHACGSTKATPRWLRDRMRAAQQRCRNPHAPAYKHYGSRGIKFKFKNPEVAARWVEEHLGLRREAYIDRIDNNGHYEPGNLRWADGFVHVSNRRNAVAPVGWKYAAHEWPFRREAVVRLIRAGLTREEIIEYARRYIAGRKPRWRVVQRTLESMTS